MSIWVEIRCIEFTPGCSSMAGGHDVGSGFVQDDAKSIRDGLALFRKDAKLHGWQRIGGNWVCPVCLESKGIVVKRGEIKKEPTVSVFPMRGGK